MSLRTPRNHRGRTSFPTREWTLCSSLQGLRGARQTACTPAYYPYIHAQKLSRGLRSKRKEHRILGSVLLGCLCLREQRPERPFTGWGKDPGTERRHGESHPSCQAHQTSVHTNQRVMGDWDQKGPWCSVPNFVTKRQRAEGGVTYERPPQGSAHHIQPRPLPMRWVLPGMPWAETNILPLFTSQHVAKCLFYFSVPMPLPFFLGYRGF